MRFLLVATVKDEGPHLLEWVAHHRRVGFTDIVIYQNGSTDGTDKMLEILDGIGVIQYFPNEMRRRGGKTPPYQNRAMQRAARLDVYKDADWCMALDGDEFLNIKTEAGDLPSLVNLCEEKLGHVDEIAISWRLFGNSGLAEFDDRMMTERFIMAEDAFRIREEFAGVKTLFRTRSFRRPAVHRPKEPFVENPVRTNGSAMPPGSFETVGWRMKDPHEAAYAQVNHYAVRDPEGFLMKKLRGTGHHPDRRVDEIYWIRFNYNNVEDRSLCDQAQSLWQEMQALDEESQGKLLQLRQGAIDVWKTKIAQMKTQTNFAELCQNLLSIQGGDLIVRRRRREGVPMARKKAQHHNFQTTTRRTREFRTWFRGEHTHYNPTQDRMISAEAVPEFVLKGWEPSEKMITPNTQITAFGSCFAANISEWLARRNYRVLNKDEQAKDAYVVTCGEGMVNSFVIRQQFEWAWEDKIFDQALWHGYKAEEYGYDPKVQAETKRIFDETDVFILTFGLSEIWYDEPTQNVFWRTIPKDVYDPDRHKFRVSTVAENKENLQAIYKLIRKHRPDAKIIFTLSPIPLIATFRNNSCLTSNSVSKSVLRVAIDETVRELQSEGYLHYWPSYEIVTDVFKYPYIADRRHPKAKPLEYIMTLFEHTWCVDGDIPKPSLTTAWAAAAAEAELFPPAMCRVINTRRWRALQRLIDADVLDGNAKIDEALKALCVRLKEEHVGQPEDSQSAAE